MADESEHIDGDRDGEVYVSWDVDDVETGMVSRANATVTI